MWGVRIAFGSCASRRRLHGAKGANQGGCLLEAFPHSSGNTREKCSSERGGFGVSTNVHRATRGIGKGLGEDGVSTHAAIDPQSFDV